MLPGLALGDPRLFEYIGSIALYIGTLIGIFTAPVFWPAVRLLAVSVYGLSALGLTAANTLFFNTNPLFFRLDGLLDRTLGRARQSTLSRCGASDLGGGDVRIHGNGSGHSRFARNLVCLPARGTDRPGTCFRHRHCGNLVSISAIRSWPRLRGSAVAGISTVGAIG
jgi:hypothetical protein